MSLIQAMATVVANEARALNNIANGTVFSKGAGLNYWGVQTPVQTPTLTPPWARPPGFLP